MNQEMEFKNIVAQYSKVAVRSLLWIMDSIVLKSIFFILSRKFSTALRGCCR